MVRSLNALKNATIFQLGISKPKGNKDHKRAELENLGERIKQIKDKRSMNKLRVIWLKSQNKVKTKDICLP